MNDVQSTPARKGPSIGLVLTALVMVLLSVGVVLWQVPLAECSACKTPSSAPSGGASEGKPAATAEPAKPAACPNCRSPMVTVDRFKPTECTACKTPSSAPSAGASEGKPAAPAPCATCNGGGKISYVKKWGYDRIKVDLDKIPNPLK